MRRPERRHGRNQRVELFVIPEFGEIKPDRSGGENRAPIRQPEQCRRALLRLFLVPALIFIPGLFWWMSHNFGTPDLLGITKWGVFAAGLLLVAQFSFWGNYIPRVFPLHLRGTGESFAANIGGRVLGTSMALFFFHFSASTPPNPGRMAETAAIIALVMGGLGLILTFFLPEPLPEEEGGH